MRRQITTFLAALLVASGCGGSDAGTTSSVSTTETLPSTTTIAPSTTTTALATTTTNIGATTTTSQQIDVYFEGGQVVGPGRFEYGIGDRVSVWALTDIDDEIHVHGYDVFFTAKDGVPVEISFTAEIPGIFEVELESTHILLFEIEVTP